MSEKKCRDDLLSLPDIALKAPAGENGSIYVSSVNKNCLRSIILKSSKLAHYLIKNPNFMSSQNMIVVRSFRLNFIS